MMENQQESKYSPLVNAIEAGDWELAKSLIDQGADVNESIEWDKGTQTPLSRTVYAGNVEFARILLKYGADVQVLILDNFSVLCIASGIETDNCAAMMQLLVEHGADIGGKPGDTEPLLLAIMKQNVAAIRYLAEKGVDVNGVFKSDGLAPAAVAVYNNKPAALRELITIGTDIKAPTISSKERKTSSTLLGYACGQCFSEIANILLENGISPNEHSFRDSDNNITPLEYAISKGNMDIIEILLRNKVDPEFVGSVGPMCVAIFEKRSDVIGMLIDHGASPNKPYPNKNQDMLPLEIAITTNDVSSAGVLLDRGARIKIKFNGFTPLGWATRAGNVQMVKLLLERGAEPNEPINSQSETLNCTPLENAISNDQLEIARILLENHADPNLSIGNVMKPLFRAIGNNPELIDLLLQNGADIEGKDVDTNTPLLIAVMRNNFNPVRKLLEKGANVNYITADGELAPLLCAVGNTLITEDDPENNQKQRQECVDIIRLLIKFGADINKKGMNDLRPIDLALMHNFPEAMEILLANRINPNIITVFGVSPLGYAIEQNYIQIVELLLKYRVDPNGPVKNEGPSPLSYAAHYGRLEIIRLLLTYNADINRSVNGLTPLSTAIFSLNASMVKLLFECGADAMEDEVVAAQSGDMDIFSLFRNRLGRNFDPHRELWILVMQDAIEKGHADTLRLLLRNGIPMHPQLRNLALQSGQLMQRAMMPSTPQDDVIFDYDMGVAYLTGQGVDEEDAERAVHLLRKAASKGLSRAQYMLGLCYKNGSGVEQDKNLALTWFTNSAKSGDPDGQYMLGLIFTRGEDVAKDHDAALKWHLAAAKQGHISSQNEAGIFYRDGLGVPVDYSQAMSWFKLGADKGNAECQNNLGAMLFNGQGCQANKIAAANLFYKAAQQGHAVASKNLELCRREGIIR